MQRYAWLKGLLLMLLPCLIFFFSILYKTKLPFIVVMNKVSGAVCGDVSMPLTALADARSA